MKAELLEESHERVHLRFSVKDTGLGMTPEQAARLFRPFTQADMSTTRKHGGTGPRRTICKRPVELLGGPIWLESAPGRGSALFLHRLGGAGGGGADGQVPSKDAPPPLRARRGRQSRRPRDSGRRAARRDGASGCGGVGSRGARGRAPERRGQAL